MTMKFNKIIEKLKEYDLLISYDECDLEFSNVSYNSKEVEKNYLFVCKGVSFKKEYLQ